MAADKGTAGPGRGTRAGLGTRGTEDRGYAGTPRVPIWRSRRTRSAIGGWVLNSDPAPPASGLTV